MKSLAKREQSWTFQFKRRDGASFVCREDPHISDFFSVLAGVKPVIFCNINEDRIEYIQGFAEFFGMAFSINESRQERRIAGPKSKTVFLAMKKGLVERAAKLWIGGAANIHNWEWSTDVLGYPACCVKFFQSWHGPYSNKSVQSGDTIARILAHTKPGVAFPFYLNDIFNMSSRLRGRGSDHLNYHKLNEINKPKPLHMYHVIPWHPCSYRCGASVKAGEKIWSLMEEILPDFAGELKRVLGKPILYLGKWEFLVLEGAIKSPREMSYSAVLEPVSLLRAGSRALVEKGNSLRIEGKLVYIFRDGRRVGSLKCARPLLLPFL